MAGPEPIEVLCIGNHRMRLEPPDIYLVAFDGDLSGAEIEQAYEAIERFARGKPGVFAISEFSRAGRTTAEARRGLMKIAPLLLGSVAIGAPLHSRVTMSLIAKASALIRKGSPVRMAFVDSEDEARVWIEAERARRIALSEA